MIASSSSAKLWDGIKHILTTCKENYVPHATSREGTLASTIEWFTSVTVPWFSAVPSSAKMRREAPGSQFSEFCWMFIVNFVGCLQ
jgi:hypothetical protein